MKSVGEVMAIGRTFQESLQKALRGLETGADGLNEVVDLGVENSRKELVKELGLPRPERLWQVADGFRAGLSIEELFGLTAIDPWFLTQIGELVALEGDIDNGGPEHHWTGDCTLLYRYDDDLQQVVDNT